MVLLRNECVSPGMAERAPRHEILLGSFYELSSRHAALVDACQASPSELNDAELLSVPF